MRVLVDNMKEQIAEMEEENESLKKNAQFQKIMFEKEKLEKEMSIRKEGRIECDLLKEVSYFILFRNTLISLFLCVINSRFH